MNKSAQTTPATLLTAKATAASFRALAGDVLSSCASTRVVDRLTVSARHGQKELSDSGSDNRQRGDWDLNPGMRDELARDVGLDTSADDTSVQDTGARVDTGVRPAAVLVPVIARDDLSVLLTVRPAHMKTHAGQISFPGGKIEPHDDGPLEAALREAEEEIALDRKFVEPLGFLDSYRTATGFLIMPVVGLVRPGFTLVLDPGEVASSFEVPLSFLMDEANHQRHSIEWQGKRRFFHAISYGERYIWGATAGIIKNLHERLNQR